MFKTVYLYLRWIFKGHIFRISWGKYKQSKKSHEIHMKNGGEYEKYGIHCDKPSDQT